MMKQRCTSFINALLLNKKLDAVLFFGLPDIRYLSDFSGSDGMLLVTSSESLFLTDSRYIDQAQTQVQADTFYCYKIKYKELAEQLSERGLLRIGFDAMALSVAQFEDICSHTSDVTWEPLRKELEPLRGVKDVQELTALKQAADLNRIAFDQVVTQIKPGMSERDVALQLEFALKTHGGGNNAFDFIVASGPRGALPHGVASDKLLAEGELVTIDFGTSVDGYYSDETITFALGSVDDQLREIFAIVLTAHDRALEATRAGLPVAELDAVARDYIASKGYGDNFGHSLGHGVGLEIHEYPGVSSRSEAILQEGMVITIEPGIYLPGIGGVRIEDTVAVTTAGCDLLTSIPKQFRQL